MERTQSQGVTEDVWVCSRCGGLRTYRTRDGKRINVGHLITKCSCGIRGVKAPESRILRVPVGAVMVLEEQPA